MNAAKEQRIIEYEIFRNSVINVSKNRRIFYINLRHPCLIGQILTFYQCLAQKSESLCWVNPIILYLFLLGIGHLSFLVSPLI